MNLYSSLEKVLRTQSKYVSNEDTILKNVVFEDAMKMDDDLIDILLGEEEIKRQCLWI